MGHADKIHNRTLQEFKTIKKDIKIIEWNVDNYYLDDTKNKFTKRTNLIDAFLLLTPMNQLSHALMIITQYHFFQIYLTHQLSS